MDMFVPKICNNNSCHWFQETQLIIEKSSISYSKDWDMNIIYSLEGFTFASALDLNLGYYHSKLDSDSQSHVTLYSHGENTKINAYCLIHNVFQNVMSKLSKIWNILRQAYYLDD
jgi:hypothetical protein